MPRKKKDERPESPDPALLQLRAEPPADDAYEAFESEIPAYLLAKVDGDELLHLLDSDGGTPFDTPRDEEGVDGAGGRLGDDDQNTLTRRNMPKPIAVQPEPIAAVGAGPVDVEDVDAGVMGNFKESTKVMRGETDADDLLKGDWQSLGDREWSVPHAKLLYLIYFHSTASTSVTTPDTWIRHPHLIVLINELVNAGVLMYSAIPASLPVTVYGVTTRVWVNMCHAALAAITELSHAGLINCLRMVTEDFTQAPAYQCSKTGMAMVRKMPVELKHQVDVALHGPYGYELEELEVKVSDRTFMLTTASGFVKRSNICDVAAVPYITSPYIPKFLRQSEREMTDNSYRQYECSMWDSEVDDMRGEAISLSNVTVLLAEWVPMGANNIFALTERLGSNTFPHTHRSLPSGQATVEIYFESGQQGDKHKDGDGDSREVVRTSLLLIDCEGSSSINFEGRRVARDGGDLPGVRREENFGFHMGVERGVVVGLQLEGLMERDWDDMCFEMVARACVDFQHHSVLFIADLLSHEQHRLLTFLFGGEEEHRLKTCCYIVDEIEPKMVASAYLDFDMYEAELNRAVGDIQVAKDLGDKTDLLFVGENGIIIAGPNTRKAERVYTDWLTLTAKDFFIRNLFVRLSTTALKIEGLHELIVQATQDPAGIDKARTRLRVLTGDLALVDQMLHLCLASLEHLTPIQRPKDQVGKDMFEGLRLNKLQEEVQHSARDLNKMYDSTYQRLQTMTERFNTEQRRVLKGVYTEVSNSADQLFRSRTDLKITHKGTVSLPSELPIRMLVICFTGTLAIEMLNRLHTGVEVGTITPSWFASGLDPMAESSPATLFVLQLVFIAIMCISGVWYLGKASKRSAEGLQKKAVINRKIVDKRALVRFLEDAGCVSANTIASRTGFNESKRELVQFTDGSFFRWFGDYPLVTMEIDLEHDFVLSATLSWDYMGKRISRCDVYQLVCDMLVESGSISTDDPRNPKKPWEK